MSVFENGQLRTSVRTSLSASASIFGLLNKRRKRSIRRPSPKCIRFGHFINPKTKTVYQPLIHACHLNTGRVLIVIKMTFDVPLKTSMVMYLQRDPSSIA
jgi:hypothetical protein